MKTLIKKSHPDQVNEIIIGKDKYVDTLYGCFRLSNPRGDPFAEEREIEIIARSGKKIKVRVPEKMRVDLPANSKAINGKFFSLEKIGKYRDVMHLLTMRAGWNQTDRDIDRMVDLDPNGTFVARLTGKNFDIPLGTCSTLPLGDNKTWIGMILVHPEARRQGIANAMMQRCVKYALDSGKVINGLDATPMGNTVYGAVGYVNSYRIWRSVFELAEFAGQKHDRNHVFTVKKNDLNEVIRYDASAFVERAEIMRGLFKDSGGGCFVCRDDNGVIKGYCFTRPGRIRPFVGPFIADNDETARALVIAAAQFLMKDKNNKTAFIDTPEGKFADKGAYAERVFDQEKKPSRHRLIKTAKPARDFTRMYQFVHYTEADKLVEQFAAAENLEKNSPRVKSFRETIYKSTLNYTETAAFMEYEREKLQEKFWGITGPEKG
ncbi:MAG: GNAT family N-acetyltransferase [Kiritimatiellae bacterium]|nr:GNAT family N-acetyltransferase [Kiritimatiellia bacterium]